jgi:hypothetical protein
MRAAGGVLLFSHSIGERSSLLFARKSGQKAAIFRDCAAFDRGGAFAWAPLDRREWEPNNAVVKTPRVKRLRFLFFFPARRRHRGM